MQAVGSERGRVGSEGFGHGHAVEVVAEAGAAVEADDVAGGAGGDCAYTRGRARGGIAEAHGTGEVAVTAAEDEAGDLGQGQHWGKAVGTPK